MCLNPLEGSGLDTKSHSQCLQCTHSLSSYSGREPRSEPYLVGVVGDGREAQTISTSFLRFWSDRKGTLKWKKKKVTYRKFIGGPWMTHGTRDPYVSQGWCYGQTSSRVPPPGRRDSDQVPVGV